MNWDDDESDKGVPDNDNLRSRKGRTPALRTAAAGPARAAVNTAAMSWWKRRPQQHVAGRRTVAVDGLLAGRTQAMDGAVKAGHDDDASNTATWSGTGTVRLPMSPSPDIEQQTT